VKEAAMAGWRGLAEVVLMVGDLERSLGFYRDTLGFRVISPPQAKGAVFLQIGDQADGVPAQIVLVQRPPDAPAWPADRRHRSVHHIGIELAPEDFERERARLQAAGFALRTGEHPFLPVQAFYLDDPDGNEIELVTTS
jgi:catechol 2,3-dioxygenase